jgi:hypothetical protein
MHPIHGGKTSSSKANFNGLKVSADVDYATFLTSWYAGITTISGCLWLTSQSVEIYIKSLLMKKNASIDVKAFSHDILKLWSCLKSTDATLQLFKYPDFEGIVQDVHTVDTNVRYGEASLYLSCNYLYLYVLLCTCLRYEIIGKSEYFSNDKYGLSSIVTRPAISSPGGEESLASKIVKKLHHLIIEHGFAATPAGFANDYKFMGLSFPPSHIAYSAQNSQLPFQNCFVCISKETGSRLTQAFFMKTYRTL